MIKLKTSGEVTLRLSIVMIALVSIAVLLRLLSKRKTKAGFVVEDWLIVIPLCLFYAYAAVLLQGVIGSGSAGSLDPKELSFPQLSRFLKYLYVTEIIFVFTITAVKLSILGFYRTIFSTPAFRRITLVLAILCILWFICVLFITIFQCRPITALWDLSIVAEGRARCIPAGGLIFGYELSNVIIDISILCLPLYMIRRLQLPTRRKIGVSLIFLLGGFVCVACIVRMVYTYNPAEPATPPSLPNVMNWSTIELGFAIICACLPTYGPLLVETAKFTQSLRSWQLSFFESLRGSRGASAGSRNNTVSRTNEDIFRYNALDDETTDTARLTPAFGKPKGNDRYTVVKSYPMTPISVQDTSRAV